MYSGSFLKKKKKKKKKKKGSKGLCFYQFSKLVGLGTVHGQNSPRRKTGKLKMDLSFGQQTKVVDFDDLQLLWRKLFQIQNWFKDKTKSSKLCIKQEIPAHIHSKDVLKSFFKVLWPFRKMTMVLWE